ncbi:MULTISPECIES: multidrug effflux MFS transporter [Sodalis]|uniref:Bcr/CflA family efflux transporter n=1 Tax=Sodalis ligni TaxID=2697027 RepID=A0A4R1NDZ6_9GAMM|nr:multidrug effflux MFS transporter [Sodalis ligni]TCL03891.1 DHA1 family bicyclomycin/chloramphenicol resistance-like MFS transporter [Sodalis ligni]
MTTSSQRLSFTLVLGSLAALGPLCTDFYLPSLPELAAGLGTTTATAQLSLTAGLLGLGLGQLFFGPLSDKLGRMRPLLASLFILLLASIGCSLARDISQLLAARFIQGLAGAGGAVLSRAVARDLYNGHDLTRFFALLMLVNGLAPIAAPVMGGALLSWTDWRGLFMVLAAIALLLLVLSVWRLRETLPASRRTPASLFGVYGGLGHLATQRQFMGLCLTQGFSMAGMFAYIGASPFVLQQIYGLSPQSFSFCFAANGLGLIAAAQIAARCSIRFGELIPLKVGLAVAGVASSALVACGVFRAPLPMILTALFFSVMINGLIGTLASSLAMQSQGKNAGSASAIIGVGMFALGALSVPVTGIGGTSVVTMGLTIWGCYIIAILIFTFVVNKKVLA